jgi:hypothetical protein
VPLGAVLVSGLPMRGGLPSSSMDGGPEPPTWGEPTATVVSTPCTPRDVGLIRVVAATYGSHADMTVDFVEDLRLAVDEACGLLLEAFTAARPDSIDRLTVRFACDAARDEIVVDAWRDDVIAAGPASDVTTMVLDALTAWWALEVSDTRASVGLRVAIGSKR